MFLCIFLSLIQAQRNKDFSVLTRRITVWHPNTRATSRATVHEGTTKMHYVLILIITNILIYSVPVTSIMCLTTPTLPPITHFCSSFSPMAWWEELKWLFPYVRSSFQPQMRRAHMEPVKVIRNLKCWKGFSRNVKCHRDVNGSRM